MKSKIFIKYFTAASMLLAPLSFRFYTNQQKAKKTVLCGPAPRKDLIRGEYENKIRYFSPPEKIFETFASGITKWIIDDKKEISAEDFLNMREQMKLEI